MPHVALILSTIPHKALSFKSITDTTPRPVGPVSLNNESIGSQAQSQTGKDSSTEVYKANRQDKTRQDLSVSGQPFDGSTIIWLSACRFAPRSRSALVTAQSCAPSGLRPRRAQCVKSSGLRPSDKVNKTRQDQNSQFLFPFSRNPHVFRGFKRALFLVSRTHMRLP